MVLSEVASKLHQEDVVVICNIGKYTHLACFIEKYLEEHADQVVVEPTEAKVSEKILKHIQKTPLAFKKAKALKTDLLQNEAISERSARFASLLTTPVKQKTSVDSTDQVSRRDRKGESKSHDTSQQPDESSTIRQQTVSRNKGNANEKTETQLEEIMSNENDDITLQDSLAANIGLDDTEYHRCLKELEKQVQALPAQLKTQKEEMMNNLKAAWRDCEQALKRRIDDVLGDEDDCQEIKKACKQKLGDVDPSSLTAKSLAILLRFLTLYNLYRLKQTCRSGSLARAFEPLLITDEMREIAAKVGMTLRLKATYDEKKFREVELFFINRDGGGIQPMTMYSDVQLEDSVNETQLSSLAEETYLIDGKFTDSSLGDLKNKELCKSMLLKLDRLHEITSSTEKHVCSLFKAGEYIRQKGSQFDIIQVVMTMTDRIQHILSSRQEILSLLSVTKYLMTDVKCQSLTFHELDEQLTQHGTLTPPITVINETLSLQARSLLPLQSSEQQQLTDSDIRYLARAQSTVQSLQSQLDTEQSKFQTALTEKIILETQLSEAKQQKSLLEKQCQSAENLQKVVTMQISEIHNLKERLEKSKAEIQKRDKLINELKTKLVQVSDEEIDIELQKKDAQSLPLGEKVITSEMEQKELSETLHNVYTETNINEFGKSEITSSKVSEMETAKSTQPEMTGREGMEMQAATPTQPVMTVRDASGMETTTSTQPEMTGREGSEMETATPTQPEMTGRDGSEMETATPTQPVMTVREGSEMETATPTQPEMTGRNGSKIETVTPTQPEMTGRDGSKMETATPTPPVMTVRDGSETETATPTQPVMTVRDGSETETVTPTQPEMTVRDGSEMETATPTQHEMTVRDGSEMETATPTQPVMTVRDGSETETATPTPPVMTVRDGSETETVTPTQPERTGRDGSETETAVTLTQPEMTGRDTSEMETATPTQPEMTVREESAMESATSTQPEMTVREGSEMETATPTQPEMTGREGSEMETATPTQPEMTVREGSEMETATPTQPEMTVRDGSETETVTPTQPEMTVREGSEMETATPTQPVMTGREGSEMETATPTQPEMTVREGSEMETATPTQPVMTVREGSEMETVTPTQPVMTGREGSEMETATPTQPVMTGREGSEMETATPTQPEMTGREGSEMETATPTPPVMTVRDGSETETVTPTQPEMTVREGSEMETATPTQPEMTVREGSEMETATPTQPEMTGREESEMETATSTQPVMSGGNVMQTAMVTMGTKQKKEKKGEGGIFSKLFQRFSGSKPKPGGIMLTPGGTEEKSASVMAGSEELPSGSVMAGSKQLPRGSLSSKDVSSSRASTKRVSGTWSRRTLKGQKGQMFNNPTGMAFHNDKLLVCDSDNNVVQILNQDYTCEKKLGSFSGQFAKPFRPLSIAVSQDNLYFILDYNNKQIVVCDQNDKIIRIITLPRDSDPWCIALVQSFVIVTDVKGHRVLKYSQDGHCVSQLGGHQGNSHSEFNHPLFVAVNSRDVIMVSDCGNHCIKCFDSDFNYLYQYGEEGDGDSQLYFPCSIAVDGADNVYVCDNGNDRISIWSRDRTWIGNLEVIKPLFMAVTPDGDRIAVRGYHSDEIVVFSK
ncbi:uncharacterized protein [Ptychodera flava]|uniref:uncharacterized protein n=1 Tax=Ptychodera flava TaxID=63121 RepID=UPI003969E92D